MREMPADLVRTLRRARDVERLAFEQSGRGGRDRAAAATGALFLSCVDAGWTVTEIAELLDMQISTVSARVRSARERLGDNGPRIDIDEPAPTRPPHPRAILRLSVEDRPWLTTAEAIAFAGISRAGLRDWDHAELLPNTQKDDGYPNLYLRADLQRVMNGPKYNRRGAHYAAIHWAIHGPSQS